MPPGHMTLLARRGSHWLLPLLVACAGEPAPGNEPSTTDELIASSFALSANGDSLGPIGRGTPFDAAALGDLFPGASIVQATRFTEGEPYPVQRIIIAGDTVLDVLSLDQVAVHSVEVFESPATGALGELLGERYDRIFDGVDETDCRAGMEEESGLALCSAPFSASITLVLSGSFDGPDGLLPPADALASWIVQRVVWRP